MGASAGGMEALTAALHANESYLVHGLDADADNGRLYVALKNGCLVCLDKE